MSKQNMPNFTQKNKEFKVQIRKETINKLLALHRIKPKFIDSDYDALAIIVDGRAILQRQSTEEQLLLAIRSMSECLKKYDFRHHQNLIKSVVLSIKNIIQHEKKVLEIIKEAALELLMLICANDSYKISFDSIPYSVLDQMNIQMIRYVLIALAHLLNNIGKEDLLKMKQYFYNGELIKILLQILGNLASKPLSFREIKYPFMYCSVTLCFLTHNWGINRNQTDFFQLLNFLVKYIENDIIKEAQKDQSLKQFFQIYYRKRDVKAVFEQSTQLQYPFGLLQLLTHIIRSYNVDMFLHLNKCLQYQIRNMCIEQSLVKCLNKILKETPVELDNDLKEEIFGYIFGLEYKITPNNCLREIILIAINHSVNKQQPDQSIFIHMADPLNQKHSKTGHLIEVMQYLEDTKDFLTQQKLLELVENYITFAGNLSYLDDSVNQLAQYKEGQIFLKNLGYEIQFVEEIKESENYYSDEIII